MSKPQTTGPSYGETVKLCSDAGGGCPTITDLGDYVKLSSTEEPRRGWYLTREDAKLLVHAAKTGRLDWLSGGAS